MSLPNIPDMTPDIRLSRREAVNLLLTSIAMEEIGISHLLNAEGEKVQYVLTKHPSVDELIRFTRTTERLLRDLIHKEILLQEKLSQVIDFECSPACEKEEYEEDDYE